MYIDSIALLCKIICKDENSKYTYILLLDKKTVFLLKKTTL